MRNSNDAKLRPKDKWRLKGNQLAPGRTRCCMLSKKTCQQLYIAILKNASHVSSPKLGEEKKRIQKGLSPNSLAAAGPLFRLLISLGTRRHY